MVVAPRSRIRLAILQQMLESPRIKDTNFFADSRGMYLILDDVNSAQEILELLGPELLDNGYVESNPITSPQRVGELLAQWVQQGR